MTPTVQSRTFSPLMIKGLLKACDAYVPGFSETGYIHEVDRIADFMTPADRSGNATVHKALNAEDRARRARGFDAIHKIFASTGAREVRDGQFGVGLHLMGGCALGTDPKRSVVGPDFRLHGHRRTFVADSSLFPNAPGINPSLTVMALALRAAEEVRA